jgi:SpoVK/Ycf46/Vps4 family AAA+-type ATPase
MSGTYTTSFRRMFILTTNRLWINENLLNRPGRIRYKKNFSDLTRAQIQEILEDCLAEKEFEEEIIEFMKPLKLITVDIVKSIVSEVNIHKESPEICCKDFNLEFKEDTYSIISLHGTGKQAKEELLVDDVNHRYVTHFINAAKIRYQGAVLETAGYRFTCVERPVGNVYKVKDIYDSGKDYKIRIDREKAYHSVFY